MPSKQSSIQPNTTPANMPVQRPRIPKTWHIATLAPGFDKNRLQFPILVATNDNSNKLSISSQSELDILLTAYQDEVSQKHPTSPSSPKRNDSVIQIPNPQQYRTGIDGLSIRSSSMSSSSSATPSFFDNEYDTPLSEHYVNGEFVCTGGLDLEFRDLALVEAEAREPVFSRGRSVNMRVRRRYKKTSRMEKVLGKFCKCLRGIRWVL